MTSLESINQIWSSAQRPLVFVGSGFRRSLLRDQVLDFFKQQQIPFVATTHSKGFFEDRHMCFQGYFGFAAAPRARIFIENYKPDALFVLGSKLGELATSGWDSILAGPEHFIHIDINPNIFNKGYKATIAHQSDLDAFARHLLTWSRSKVPNFTKNQNLRTTFFDTHSLNERPIHPRKLIKVLESLLPENCLIVSEIGNTMAWLINDFEITKARELFIPLGFGSMGSGIGASIGAALAIQSESPRQPIICISGDCSMIMHGNEILTAKEYQLGIVFIVLNDGGHGMVYHGHNLLNLPNVKTRFQQRVNFEKFADAYGVEAISCSCLNDVLKLNFESMPKNRPIVIDIEIDHKAVPPILSRTRVLGQSDQFKER